MFFDAGETLIHPQPSFPTLFSRVMADEGHPVEPSAVEAAAGLVARHFDEAARDGRRWTTSPERSRAFWASVYRTFLEALGIPDSEELHVRLYATFSDPCNYGLFPDVAPVLADLDVRGYAMGVISNFEAWLDTLLERLEVGALLPVRAISGVEGVEKPDPALFRVALERAGVDAAECAYVGDNPAFDMEPAAALGMFPVLIDRHDRHPASPHTRITSMADLPAVLGA